MFPGNKEKRHSERINLHVPVRFQARGCAAASNGLSEDISRGGLSLICDNFFPTQTALMLEIGLPLHLLRPIGRIAWSQPLPRSNKNRLGIEFLEFDRRERNYLGDYISLRQGKF
ncbi:MAG: PilZ domain-containing protein [Candidatus Omnitrophota bacterium]|nr:PilZ domain-containing protein [Candidatus Omnitrophota bacterium]